MTTGAIIMMLVVQVTVTVITLYFFMKVLFSPLKNKDRPGGTE